jgi:hypothetical protein
MGIHTIGSYQQLPDRLRAPGAAPYAGPAAVPAYNADAYRPAGHVAPPLPGQAPAIPAPVGGGPTKSAPPQGRGRGRDQLIATGEPSPGLRPPAPGGTKGVTRGAGPERPASPFAVFLNVAVGQRFSVADGTTIKGIDIAGTAVVKRFDGNSIALAVDGSTLAGIIKVKAAVEATANADGTVSLKATELDAAGKVKRVAFDDKLRVVSQAPGRLELRTPEGLSASIARRADGGLVIRHPEGTVRLNRA